MKLKNIRFMLIAVWIGIIISTPLSFAKSSTDKTSIREVKQEANELLRALKSYTADQKDEAVRKTKTALDHLDRRIKTLETRIDNQWDSMNTAAREKARASLKALRQQRNQVAESYRSLKNSSAGAWDHMKQGFSKAYQDLHKAWENAEREFKTENNKKRNKDSK